LNVKKIGEFQLETIKLISPIDGSVYAERPIVSDSALDAAVSRLRSAANFAPSSLKRCCR
jgi:acyl-CoA reductase-like NAD-dependent aldehyde dehydrogenase